jgi:hypothetical protein
VNRRSKCVTLQDGFESINQLINQSIIMGDAMRRNEREGRVSARKATETDGDRESRPSYRYRYKKPTPYKYRYRPEIHDTSSSSEHQPLSLSSTAFLFFFPLVLHTHHLSFSLSLSPLITQPRSITPFGSPQLTSRLHTRTMKGLLKLGRVIHRALSKRFHQVSELEP